MHLPSHLCSTPGVCIVFCRPIVSGITTLSPSSVLDVSRWLLSQIDASNQYRLRVSGLVSASARQTSSWHRLEKHTTDYRQFDGCNTLPPPGGDWVTALVLKVFVFLLAQFICLNAVLFISSMIYIKTHLGLGDPQLGYSDSISLVMIFFILVIINIDFLDLAFPSSMSFVFHVILLCFIFSFF